MNWPTETNYTRSQRLQGATREGALRVHVRRARMAASALRRLWQADRTFGRQAVGTAARAKAARKADDAQAHWRTVDARVSRVRPVVVSHLPAGIFVAQCLPRDDAHTCDATCLYLLRALAEDAARAEEDARRQALDDARAYVEQVERWHDEDGQ